MGDNISGTCEILAWCPVEKKDKTKLVLKQNNFTSRTPSASPSLIFPRNVSACRNKLPSFWRSHFGRKKREKGSMDI
ncbi:hypothetical protein E2320_018072, partial [Naja naja]